MTCGGEAASSDMILSVLAGDRGPHLAAGAFARPLPLAVRLQKRLAAIPHREAEPKPGGQISPRLLAHRHAFDRDDGRMRVSNQRVRGFRPAMPKPF